jgi:hypothetical protein
MFLTCGWLYGKGKKILQQAAGELRSRLLEKAPKQGGRWEVFSFQGFSQRRGAKGL